MRPLSIVGTSLLFAGCLTEPDDSASSSAVAVAGAACDTEGGWACAADPADTAGYACLDGAWTADASCVCDDDGVTVNCSDIDIGFTGVTRAGAPRPAGRRLRIA